MKIIRSENSKLKDVDFNNLSFGTIFSDHMFMSKYSNDSWKNPQILPYGSFSLDPSTSSFHYGQAVFEGMKAYKDSKEKVWLFRPEENFKRMNKSLIRLNMPELPKNLFFSGLTNLLSLDSGWIKPGMGNSLYVRPFVFASSPNLQAAPSKEYIFFIICCPVKSYYGGRVDVLISEKYSRAASGGVGYAKAAGNYAASFYPTKLANKNGYNQVIWTDAIEHKYIEEAGTMNIWFRIKDKLITPEISDSILSGITRDSVLTLSKENNYTIEERKISVDEIIESYRNGDLVEVFGTGTAVAVSPIESITVKESLLKIPKVKDSFALNLKAQLQSIQNGSLKDKYGWTFKIKKK